MYEQKVQHFPLHLVSMVPDQHWLAHASPSAKTVASLPWQPREGPQLSNLAFTRFVSL